MASFFSTPGAKIGAVCRIEPEQGAAGGSKAYLVADFTVSEAGQELSGGWGPPASSTT